MTPYQGRCLCGRVEVTVHGEPLRVGICHCMDCRKESGSAFTFYGIWPAEAFERTGESSAFQGRHFCTSCGARLFAVDDKEVEIKLGILEPAPTPLVPRYELWIKRREPWLQPIKGAEQFVQDRT